MIEAKHFAKAKEILRREITSRGKTAVHQKQVEEMKYVYTVIVRAQEELAQRCQGKLPEMEESNEGHKGEAAKAGSPAVVGGAVSDRANAGSVLANDQGTVQSMQGGAENGAGPADVADDAGGGSASEATESEGKVDDTGNPAGEVTP